jgi:hypothetical protein
LSVTRFPNDAREGLTRERGTGTSVNQLEPRTFNPGAGVTVDFLTNRELNPRRANQLLNMKLDRLTADACFAV